jgi:hypothetical protein
MTNREDPYKGMTQSDIAAENDAADETLEEHEIIANEPD